MVDIFVTAALASLAVFIVVVSIELRGIFPAFDFARSENAEQRDFDLTRRLWNWVIIGARERYIIVGNVLEGRLRIVAITHDAPISLVLAIHIQVIITVKLTLVSAFLHLLPSPLDFRCGVLVPFQIQTIKPPF